MTDRLMDEIVDFWFDDACKPYWFNSRPTFDRLVRDNLLEHHQKAAAGELDHWIDDVDGALALCILLDQAPRNCFRGRAEAFATDAKARSVALHALNEGYDLECTEDERMFFYMPFMHHEDADSQLLAVKMFAERCPRPEAVVAAQRHSEIIARFGRFPQRNIALGRVCSPEEESFLSEPNASF
ncbi:DUF924 domain-containing protein [bacterium]|nr:DUF924 domain-containing protein [bacterium]